MNANTFMTILKCRINDNALSYLTNKQKTKGQEMKYTEMQLAEYLSHINSKLTIIQKQTMFALHNRMFEISENFPGKQMEDECVCTEREEMLHIYNCEILSEGRKPTLIYENIFGDNINKQIEVFKHCELNLDNRESMMNRETN